MKKILFISAIALLSTNVFASDDGYNDGDIMMFGSTMGTLMGLGTISALPIATTQATSGTGATSVESQDAVIVAANEEALVYLSEEGSEPGVKLAAAFTEMRKQGNAGTDSQLAAQILRINAK